ncbi:MAG: chemotaxis protein CheW [Bacteroidales bacterium]|jgi:purine-binding chemotaxis protein CheW|nr:chemotaxis protein CheW [Bacteroidales bacterium]
MAKKDIRIKDVLLFRDGNLQFAIPLKFIDRVIPAQEITPVATTSHYIKGVIDIQGEVIPVLSLTCRFGLVYKEFTSEEHFIILNYNNNRIALIADNSCTITSITDDEIKEIKTVFNGLSAIKLVNGDKGIIYLYDTDTFFSKDDILELDMVFGKRSGR